MWFTEAIEVIMEDQLLLFAVPVFLLSMCVEMYIDRRQHTARYETRDTLVSLSMGIISLIVEFLPKVLAFVAFAWMHSVSPLRDTIGRQWWAWMLLFFADDLAYYWFHRMNHEVRLFWAGHVMHHSSVRLHFGTALRQGVGERLHKFIFWMWLPLLGFDALMIYTMISINLIYQFFTHTELIRRLPRWFEYIFNTPSHHRVHHASNARYLDRNHAGVLIIWDRMFGTFSQELDREPPVYGLVKNIDSFHPGYVATHEYGAIWRDVRRAKKLRHKLMYIFGPPGWSHDGPDQRARTLRQQVRD